MGLTYVSDMFLLEEKIAAILALDEELSANEEDESREDALFYNRLSQSLMTEINHHPYIQDIVSRYAILEDYDANDINMPFGYDCNDFISKLQILKYYEEDLDVADYFDQRNELTGNEVWGGIEEFWTTSNPRGIQYTLHNKWANNTVDYMWNTSNSTIRSNMQTAMQDWRSASNSHITFKEITKHKSRNITLWLLGWKYFIRINASNSHNYQGRSTLGMVPWATIRIKPPTGDNTVISTCRHEMGHSLGLLHEHQRPDRDDYIIYQPQNVKIGMRAQFVKPPAGSYNYHSSTFDFESIMLYGSTACQKNSSVYTLVKLDSTHFTSPLYISETDEYVIQQIYD